MGLATLAQVLRPLHEVFQPEQHPELLVGLHGADDAAVYQISEDLALIQTLDFFAPVVDDPFTYGQIAAANAMSDIYAMGGEVQLALNIAAFPDDLDPAMLAEIFRGGADKVAEAGGVIAGGHTVIDQEPKYGLSVTGIVHPDAIITTAGAQPGDVLVLTKPIGTGVLLTAMKQQREGAQPGFDAAVAMMLELNRHTAHLARAANVHAMTDVTGFGLLGHAMEVADRGGVAVEIDAEAVPLLPDALRFAEEGAITGGGGRNLEQLGDRVQRPDEIATPLLDLLYDPQTSGGLLMALPESDAPALCASVEAERGGCWIVGRIVEGEPAVRVR